MYVCMCQLTISFFILTEKVDLLLKIVHQNSSGGNDSCVPKLTRRRTEKELYLRPEMTILFRTQPAHRSGSIVAVPSENDAETIDAQEVSSAAGTDRYLPSDVLRQNEFAHAYEQPYHENRKELTGTGKEVFHA